MKLRWIQRYYGGSKSVPPPLCELVDRCNSRATGMWVDEEGHAHDLCEAHRIALDAPPMVEGICYAPTHS